uniref:Hemerythrin n=1 Tax=Selachohemecus olsoni TaxID=2032707 RepID=A0A286RT95_9TREM|nr:hemerythrin [Selachohemecus olsoni]
MPTIPNPFRWDESFKVFYDSLDEQHKGLFDAIRRLDENRGDAGALTNLQAVIDQHFTDENKAMSDSGYSGFSAHKNAHADFQGKLSQVTLPASNTTIDWAKDWLVNHIKGTDFQYKKKLSALE